MSPVRLLLVAVLLAASTACSESESTGSATTETEIAKTAVAPTVAFEPVAWTIEFNPLGEVHSVSMIANVGPLTVGDVQDLGGSLVWDETSAT